MSENKYYTYQDSSFMYHLILFASFCGAVKLIPWLTTQLQKYITNEYAMWVAPLLAAYLLAIYILPEVGFFGYRQFSEKR